MSPLSAVIYLTAPVVTGQFLLDICHSNSACYLKDENFSAVANCIYGFLGFEVMRFGL